MNRNSRFVSVVLVVCLVFTSWALPATAHAGFVADAVSGIVDAVVDVVKEVASNPILQVAAMVAIAYFTGYVPFDVVEVPGLSTVASITDTGVMLNTGASTFVGLAGYGPTFTALEGAVAFNSVVEGTVLCVAGITCRGTNDPSPVAGPGSAVANNVNPDVSKNPYISGAAGIANTISCPSDQKACGIDKCIPLDSSCCSLNFHAFASCPAKYDCNIGYKNSDGNFTPVGPAWDPKSLPSYYSGAVGARLIDNYISKDPNTGEQSFTGTAQCTYNPNFVASSCSQIYTCQGDELYFQDRLCKSSFEQKCTYGCSAGACNPVPPISVTRHLEAKPSLLSKGSTSNVYWDVVNAKTCSVSGDNGDSWPDILSSGAAGKTTSAITGQTIYTLSCASLPGAAIPSISETQTVNVVPTFQEK